MFLYSHAKNVAEVEIVKIQKERIRIANFGQKKATAKIIDMWIIWNFVAKKLVSFVKSVVAQQK